MNAITQSRADTTPAVQVRQQMEAMAPQFALALPPHVPADRFVRVVMTAIQSNPDLLKKERQSLFEAAMKCAQDGLLPDGREAALVIHGGKVTYMPMVAGILSKVRRSGELSTIGAHVVYEKDEFDYMLGDDERIHHKPFLGPDRGKPIVTYAVARTKDGGVYREVMTEAQVMAVRSISRAQNGPWSGPFADEMRRKTAIRRLSKRLPMSTDLLAVIERDDELYDLNKAQPVQVRRLHADFEEATSLPAADGATALTDKTGADDTSGDDHFPGDAPLSAGGGEAAEPPKPDGDEEKGPAADLLKWASKLQEDVDGLSLEQIDLILGDPKEIANFAALEASQPQIAMDLNKAITRRRKEVA